jgi:hypothetical protein
MTAAMLVLEAIFEADLPSELYAGVHSAAWLTTKTRPNIFAACAAGNT